MSAIRRLAAMLALVMTVMLANAQDATSQQSKCISNLRELDSAKDMAAIVIGWDEGHAIAPSSSDEKSVLEYVKGEAMPKCPSGGRYTLGAIGAVPTCSTSGHKIEPLSPEAKAEVEKAAKEFIEGVQRVNDSSPAGARGRK